MTVFHGTGFVVSCRVSVGPVPRAGHDVDDGTTAAIGGLTNVWNELEHNLVPEHICNNYMRFVGDSLGLRIGVDSTMPLARQYDIVTGDSRRLFLTDDPNTGDQCSDFTRLFWNEFHRDRSSDEQFPQLPPLLAQYRTA